MLSKLGRSSSVPLGLRSSLLAGRFVSAEKALSRSVPRSNKALATVHEESSSVQPLARHVSAPVAAVSSHSSITGSFRRIVKGPVAEMVIKNIPYGNAHMGLMVGPLIFENGVPE
jgi:hypothetical protein